MRILAVIETWPGGVESTTSRSYLGLSQKAHPRPRLPARGDWMGLINGLAAQESIHTDELNPLLSRRFCTPFQCCIPSQRAASEDVAVTRVQLRRG